MDFEKPFASEVTKLAFSLIKKIIENTGSSQVEIEPKLASSIAGALNWSRAIQFFGMSSAVETSEVSIELMISTSPRKFSSVKNADRIITEKDLLSRNENIILLGQPGSGKTTTLKRLTNHLIVEPSDCTDSYHYPVVVKVKDLEHGESLQTAVCKYLGLTVESKIISEQVSNEYGQLETFKTTQKFIGENLLSESLPKILDETRAIIFLDGLDEASPKIRGMIESDITWFSNQLNFCKLIVTCRSGDYSTQIDGFNIFELEDLDQIQVSKMVSNWANSPEEFFDALNVAPYKDVSNRPLFLAQLIVIFNIYGDLPEQPYDVYSKLIRLVIEDWDKQRRHKRVSQYSNFGTEKKLQFLAAISYELTYVIKTKRFNTNDLIKAYRNIYEVFDLPKHEAEAVALELESHTGLIIKSGYKHFEFSHLSLQEYLCANYLVKDPISDVVLNYFQEYPAPLAVAVAMASNPSNWFSLILLLDSEMKNIGQKQLNSFLNRLSQEKPNFSKSVIFGAAVLKAIIAINVDEQHQYFSDFLKQKNVIPSLAEALIHFQFDFKQKDQDFYSFNKRFGSLNKYNFKFPESGKICTKVLNQILDSSKTQFVESPYLKVFYINKK